ncbi:MAG: hypothetical protein ACREHE_07185 [Rhizomicrobium sp.]
MSGAGQQAQAKAGAVPLMDAVTTQRESVLSGFDSQREAIIKAVEEQRRAAMASGSTAQARQQGRPAVPVSGVPNRQQSVAADIVATLKAMVAEEVRTQLLALLAAAEARQAATAAPPPVVPAA